MFAYFFCCRLFFVSFFAACLAGPHSITLIAKTEMCRGDLDDIKSHIFFFVGFILIICNWKKKHLFSGRLCSGLCNENEANSSCRNKINKIKINSNRMQLQFLLHFVYICPRNRLLKHRRMFAPTTPKKSQTKLTLEIYVKNMQIAWFCGNSLNFLTYIFTFKCLASAFLLFRFGFSAFLLVVCMSTLLFISTLTSPNNKGKRATQQKQRKKESQKKKDVKNIKNIGIQARAIALWKSFFNVFWIYILCSAYDSTHTETHTQNDTTKKNVLFHIQIAKR